MQKPRIIITPALSDNQRNLLINRGYYDSVLRAGGIPILLPLTDDPAVLDAYLASCEGVLFSGGPDVHPHRYGESVHPACGTINELRDTMELYLLQRLLAEKSRPIFCICRGIQVLNVALHGTLYQDIPTEYSGFVFSHSQPEHECDHAHHVTVVENTLLSEIVQCSSLSVNSLHHQAILSLAPALRSCGVSEDGLIESVYLPDYPFCLGVQWHPERLADHDPHSQMLFNAFCRACSDMKP
ncbi:MAG: gamma-glutamyl-gamma-aminobutyrate hydrolase family protein [Clostridia bacterium]|nr:gamma-glutamyl-gamma-aminobutyrate hydrolase family protein [Clostridia bacterium]MBQ9288887.1 gamma-glutamyl-gamma-aminobutyrate hydrolase family protein [Clostridia bacterium]